tara:strand:- start:1111 stop:1872 length:762 start_codon:yes stop_codon:yes gene_type:complete
MAMVSGKTILVTGGASGIGKATAYLLADEGAHVIIADLQNDDGAETANQIVSAGGVAEYHHVDVTSPMQVSSLVGGIVQRYGSLDGAFNNAGIESRGAKLARICMDDWQRSIEINLTSMYICARIEVEQMLKQKKGGSIVNTSSIAGLIGLPGSADYNAAKSGVIGLTKTVALEYAKKNIRVNAISPGFIHTPMWERTVANDSKFQDDLKSIVAIGRTGKPSELAEAAVWLLSDRSSYVTGITLPVDGGYTAG